MKLATKISLGMIASMLALGLVAVPIYAREGSPKPKNNRGTPAPEASSTPKPKNTLFRLFKQTSAVLRSATVTEVDGSTLTVTSDGAIYTIQTDDKTKFRRLFWGKGDLSDIKVGHSVNVIGTWVDEAKTTIKAKMIRDLSVQKRRGAFIGTVKSITGQMVVIETVNRGTQTVTVLNTTRIINRKEEAITLSDLLVGHRIRVKGLWDKVASLITEVTEVKDFSLPVKQTPASESTATPES